MKTRGRVAGKLAWSLVDLSWLKAVGEGRDGSAADPRRLYEAVGEGRYGSATDPRRLSEAPGDGRVAGSWEAVSCNGLLLLLLFTVEVLLTLKNKENSMLSYVTVSRMYWYTILYEVRMN
jgi:hypothetical protein